MAIDLFPCPLLPSVLGLGCALCLSLKDAMVVILKSLMPGCLFNILGFGSTFRALFSTSQNYQEVNNNKNNNGILSMTDAALCDTVPPSSPPSFVFYWDGEKKKENIYFPVSPFIKGRTQQHITLCVLVATVPRSCTRTSLCVTHVRVSPSLLAHIKKRKTSYSLYNVWFVFVCLWLLSRHWLGHAGPRLWVHQEGEGGHGRDQPAGPAPLGPQAAPAERPPPAALPADRRGGQQHGQGHRVGAQPRALRPVGFIIAMHAYARWCVICCFPWRPLAAGGVEITPGWGCVLGESLLCSFVYNMQITIVH